MKATVLPVDFGRIVKVFITKCVGGQYYYAQQNQNGEVGWERQVHTSESRPFFKCTPQMAVLISEAIRDDNKRNCAVTNVNGIDAVKQSDAQALWCCKFNDGEWIVSTLRGSQKGSIKAVRNLLGEKWKALKNRGIRCSKISLTEIQE